MSANLKRGCGILLTASVVLLSILALLPDADVDHDAGYTSSELSIRETVDGSMTSTSYVNPTGFITDAIDMDYATVCRIWDENGRIVEEHYLDESGNPVARYGDYYGLLYEYDETSMVITYLDAERNPIIRSDGYSTIVSVANALQITPIKVRKMLITAGYYSTAMSRKVQALQDEGYSVREIMEETGLKKASVNGYLPYTKGAYKLESPTLYAEQGRLFRSRKVFCFIQPKV